MRTPTTTRILAGIAIGIAIAGCTPTPNEGITCDYDDQIVHEGYCINPDSLADAKHDYEQSLITDAINELILDGTLIWEWDLPDEFLPNEYKTVVETVPEIIHEDDARWNCNTMGNLVCGKGANQNIPN